MSNKNEKTKQQIPIDRHPLHPERKLVSRRDFLSAGVLGFAGTAVLPSVLEMTLLERVARAGGTGTSTMPPLMIFDCAGGAALPGNWPPMDQGGNPLADYGNLGLINTQAWTLDSRFGAPMAGPLPPPQTTNVQSNIFAALSMLPANVQACIQMGIMPANSMSDSQSNTFSPISLASAAGLVGTKVPQGLGMTAAESGGNSDWVSGNSAFKPMQIKSVDSLAAALSYGPAFKSLPIGMIDALAKALVRLSGSQAAQFNNMTLGQQFNSLLQAGYVKNQSYNTGVQGIDPRNDPDAESIYGISPTSDGSSQQVVYATLALNAILGNSGPVVMTIGGCDYHDGSQTTGDNKDTQIGQTIADALWLAFKKNTKVCFMVCTDGGIFSDYGLRTWRGDDNLHGLAVFGVMDPAGKPSMLKTQVGYYNSAQVTAPELAVANDPAKVGQAMFLNYLAVAGMADQFGTIIAQQDPRNAMLLPNVYSGSTSAMLNDLLMFPNLKKG